MAAGTGTMVGEICRGVQGLVFYFLVEQQDLRNNQRTVRGLAEVGDKVMITSDSIQAVRTARSSGNESSKGLQREDIILKP